MLQITGSCEILRHSVLVGVFLTVAHLVPKRLLVACELTSGLGIPSEPRTELVPSAFRVEELAILAGDLPF